MSFSKLRSAARNTLDKLYRHRIIHKDIKLANILINPETKQVKLIDFSIASLLPRETQTPMSPNAIDGTLSYLSPEQTGRMNREIDYRTDFYSLGVTFYELLTGELPFQSNDPMELVQLPEHPTTEMMPPAQESIRQKLSEIEGVTNLPLMSDPEKLAAMNILSTMASAAYIGLPALYPLIAIEQIELSLQFGNAIETPYAYSTYGLILCAFGGEIAAGNRAADIAFTLLEKLQTFRFSEKVKNRIFDHLFTTKDVGKGTGLGLAIARQIVEEKHGGKQSCISAQGEGTEFVIEVLID